MRTEHRSTQLSPLAPNNPRAQNHSIPRRWFARVFGAFLLLATFALRAAPAQAQGQWSVAGQFIINQGSIPITLNLQQSGKKFSGTASFEGVTSKGTEILPYVGGTFGSRGTITGKVTGTAEDNNFDMEVAWSNGQTGIYYGTFYENGLLKGEGYERRSPKIKARWKAARTFERTVAPAPAPVVNATPPPKVLRAGPKPATPPPKVLKADGKPKIFIHVTPGIVVIPAEKSTATVTLSWNAGPDHPNAVVQMKASGGGASGEFKTVAVQAQGSRGISVERGPAGYQFILTDQGQELARVACIIKR